LRADLAQRTAEVAKANAERDEADAECREANASWCREAKECIDLNRELASMREQRDEARRIACSAYAARGRDLATERGWKCFDEKEETA